MTANRTSWLRPLAALLLICVAVSGCNRTPDKPLTVWDLKMPVEQFPGVLEISDKSVVVDEHSEKEGEPVPISLQVFRQSGITSSAYFKYKVGRDGQTHTIKVKMNLYSDAEKCQDGWSRRYPEHVAEYAKPWNIGD